MISRYTDPKMGAVWTDENKYRTWLRIEILACEAMNKLGVIPSADLARIKKRARFDARRIDRIEKKVHHDVIAFLTNLAENVGPSSRYIHHGLTSSDILDTALSVLMVQAVDLLTGDLDDVRKAAAFMARRFKHTPMIGRTHGVHAEPITFGLKMALMYDEFGRARKRLVAARDTIAVGKLSGAVGTHAHLSPKVEQYVCRRLQLKPATISTQVLQRDRHAEYMCALANVGASVERWALEFRHLQRTEVLEVEEGFGPEQKGSSAMPHKKNPITAEKLCGLARLLRGNCLAALENVALWHERDISHSSVERVIIPDSTIALDHMLRQLARLLRKMKVNPDRMKANLGLTQGLTSSQQVLLMLTKKGIGRERAYGIVQRNAMKAWEDRTSFRALVEADPEIAGKVSPTDLDRAFDQTMHFKDIGRVFTSLGL